MKYLLLLLSLTSAAFSQMPLGTIFNVTSVSCPSGFYSGATCHVATVACPSTDPITVTFGFKKPKHTLKGTIVLHAGGGGMNPFNLNSYMDAYLNAGYQIVQIAWTSAWELATASGTENIRVAACRPATIIKYIYQTVYGGTAGTGGFCGHGHSGGSGAFGYALAWYGLDSILDKVLLTSGPVFGNVAEGCVVPASPPLQVCPSGQFGCVGSFWSDLPAYLGGLGSWTGYANCNNQSAPPTTTDEYASLVAESIVDAGANFSYPQTALSGWLCSNGTNNSAAQGQYFYQQFTSPSQTAAYGVYRIDNCTGPEDIWNGTTTSGVSGLTASTNDMLDSIVGCIKRH